MDYFTASGPRRHARAVVAAVVVVAMGVALRSAVGAWATAPLLAAAMVAGLVVIWVAIERWADRRRRTRSARRVRVGASRLI